MSPCEANRFAPNFRRLGGNLWGNGAPISPHRAHHNLSMQIDFPATLVGAYYSYSPILALSSARYRGCDQTNMRKIVADD